jgi:hypothetical protein
LGQRRQTGEGTRLRSETWTRTRQTNISEEILQHAGSGLDNVAEGVRFALADDAGVGHFGDDLCGEIIVGSELSGEEWSTEKFFECVGDAMEEF